MREEVTRLIGAPTEDARISCLKALIDTKQTIPLHLAIDLLEIPLGEKVHTNILRCIANDNPLALEDFLTQNFSEWPQNLASVALYQWCKITSCLLWHRTIPLLMNPNLSQRLSYTLLSQAWFVGGELVVKRYAEQEDLLSMSTAFLSLLLKRAVEWNIESEELKIVALHVMQNLDVLPSERACGIPYALAYLARYARDILNSISWANGHCHTWSDIVKTIQKDVYNENIGKAITKALTKNSSKSDLGEIWKIWPASWNRFQLTAEHVAAFLNKSMTSELLTGLDAPCCWRVFAGIPSEVLVAGLAKVDDFETYSAGLSLTGNLISLNQHEQLARGLEQRSHRPESELSTQLVARIPEKFRMLMHKQYVGDLYQPIIDEQRAFLAAHEAVQPSYSFQPLQQYFNQKASLSNDEVSRHEFLTKVRRGEKSERPMGGTYWDMLTKAWCDPQDGLLESLAEVARKSGPIFRTCYIDTLGQFKGSDQATLKLLDFIRSDQGDVLDSVIKALNGIGTKRATLELICFLTRPNSSFTLQMEIVNLLQDVDLTSFQQELRSAINDLHVDPMTINYQNELLTNLKSLLLPVAELSSCTAKRDWVSDFKTNELDEVIEKKIVCFNRLSSESKRALRTALFFQNKVEASGNPNSIDLSPAIDMQYKAMELTFRELFENQTSLLINQGVLQKKLDVIGYARPVQSATEDFERFIETLPIINTIPFFSRFKLRKMLRGISQFRRGKRFTLDGLKAFALFFICFSRKSCRHGLANLFEISALKEEEIYEFARKLHVFQDFRNRAAHEGFHPDASNNLQKIWDDTADIIDQAFIVSESIGKCFSEKIGAEKNKKEPIIIHKRAS